MYEEWYFTEYYQEGEIEDWVIPGRRVTPLNTWGHYVLALNLDQERDADIDLTFFFENDEPATTRYRLGAGRQGTLYLGSRGGFEYEVDLNRRFGMAVKSTTPLMVQCTQGDYIDGSPVTNNMVSNMFVPGPLAAKHRVWYYVDCIVLRSQSPLEEREWITLLNSNAEPAQVTITFFPGGGFQRPGEEVKRGDTPFRYRLDVPARRICQVHLHEQVTDVRPNTHYGVKIESSVPITAQAARRIFERGNYAYSNSIAVLDCFPAGE